MLPLINREFYWSVLRIVFRLPVCSTARRWDVCILRRRGSPARQINTIELQKRFDFITMTATERLQKFSSIFTLSRTVSACNSRRAPTSSLPCFLIPGCRHSLWMSLYQQENSCCAEWRDEKVALFTPKSLFTHDIYLTMKESSWLPSI